jgi:hypothetical protein
MDIELRADDAVQVENHHNAAIKNVDYLRSTVSYKEIEPRGGYGVPVGEIDIENLTGEKGRFHLTAFVRNGRPVLSIRTTWNGDKDVVKKVQGVFNKL